MHKRYLILISVAFILSMKIFVDIEDIKIYGILVLNSFVPSFFLVIILFRLFRSNSISSTIIIFGLLGLIQFGNYYYAWINVAYPLNIVLPVCIITVPLLFDKTLKVK